MHGWRSNVNMLRLKNSYRFLILSFIFVNFTCSTIAGETIKLKDLLNSCEDIADSTSSRWINPKISGQKVKINGKSFEARYFSFEDTTKLLPSGTTFKEYVKQKNLMDKEGTETSPLHGIDFYSFDFRSINLNDKVYFSMAIRAIPQLCLRM